MSQDINYALISALYSNKTGGLYSDVYFPIIKYTIVQLFNQKSLGNPTQYYLASDVHDYIWDRFRINIPIIVITKSLQKIDKAEKAFVELTLLENGNSFQIRKLWGAREFDDSAAREITFSEGLEKIEADYKEFLDQNGTFDDGVSYLQFISDNTEDVLGYFQNNDSSVIDEKYTTIIFFLEYLHNNPAKQDEFDIANQLFWASIIAGYLRSEKPLVDAAEDGHRKEYFLDTAILMGMLELSSRQKEAYCKEIREIINASGGLMKVHPMTLEEIKTILGSVEASGNPDPGTDIAEAWINHGLNINKLANFRLNLSKKLEGLGVKVFPLVGPDDCKRNARAYAKKKIVEELAQERAIRPSSYSQDNFREIHDVFMDDYIKGRRKDMGDSEDVVFVTANMDLISFTKRVHPDNCYMISTGRVVLDLWMHNVKPSDISSCALTETMARCLDRHNVRVRSKIAEVSKFYNENKGNFDAQVYTDFIKKLYQRARNVIMTVEANSDDLGSLGIQIGQRILDAVKADQEYIEKKNYETEGVDLELANRLNVEKEKLTKANEEQAAQITDLTQKNSHLESEMAIAKKSLTQVEQKANEEKAARENAETIVALYQRRDELEKKQKEVDLDLAPLIKEREKSFRNYGPKLLMLIGIACFLGALSVAIIGVIRQTYWILTMAAALVALGVFFCNRANTLNDRETDRKQKAYEEWEKKEENLKYKHLIKSKEAIDNELKEIKEKLI